MKLIVISDVLICCPYSLGNYAQKITFILVSLHSSRVDARFGCGTVGPGICLGLGLGKQAPRLRNEPPHRRYFDRHRTPNQLRLRRSSRPQRLHESLQRRRAFIFCQLCRPSPIRPPQPATPSLGPPRPPGRAAQLRSQSPNRNRHQLRDYRARPPRRTPQSRRAFRILPGFLRRTNSRKRGSIGL